MNKNAEQNREKEIMFAGAAKRNITPPEDLMGGLRMIGSKKFVTVEDELYVRVLAIKKGEKTLLFCGFDLDKAPNPEKSMQAIEEKYGITEECITFYGIHTHTAPVLGNREKEPPMNNPRLLGPEVSEATGRCEEFVFNQLMEAVADALDQMRPAVLRLGSEPCGCNVNRYADYCSVDEEGNVKTVIKGGSNLLGPVDHTIYVMGFETPEGEPIAYLINYAMHNTIMFMHGIDENDNYPVSCDVGGTVSQMLEKKFPGAVALWCSGAAGDAGPFNPGLDHFDREPGEPEYAFLYREQRAELKQICNNQYAAILKAISEESDPLEITEPKAEIRWTETPGRTIIREGKFPNQKITVLSGPDVPPYRIRLHFVCIGKLLIIGIGGELYSTYARDLREKFPGYHVIVINHDASLIDDADYILDDDVCARVEAVPKGEFSVPNGPVRYEPGYISAALLEAAREAVKDFEKNAQQ